MNRQEQLELCWYTLKKQHCAVARLIYCTRYIIAISAILLCSILVLVFLHDILWLLYTMHKMMNMIADVIGHINYSALEAQIGVVIAIYEIAEKRLKKSHRRKPARPRSNKVAQLHSRKQKKYSRQLSRYRYDWRTF